jgi:hypothetical protein
LFIVKGKEIIRRQLQDLIQNFDGGLNERATDGVEELIFFRFFMDTWFAQVHAEKISAQD